MVLFYIIFWHPSTPTVSKIRWSYFSDFQYIVRYSLGKLWNRHKMHDLSLCNFGYLGFAHVSLLSKVPSFDEDLWKGGRQIVLYKAQQLSQPYQAKTKTKKSTTIGRFLYFQYGLPSSMYFFSLSQSSWYMPLMYLYIITLKLFTHLGKNQQSQNYYCSMNIYDHSCFSAHTTLLLLN